MIRVSARTGQLAQRLRAQAARFAAAHLRKRPRGRADWHSAAALWPEMFGDIHDGK